MLNALRRNGAIIHVVDKFPAIQTRDKLSRLRRNDGYAGNVVYELAKRQIRSGFDVSVVIEQPKNIDPSLNYDKVTGSCRRYIIDGVPVYVIENKDCFLRKGHDNSFSTAFWYLLNNKAIFPHISLVHGHGDITIPLLTKVLDCEHPGRTIFTPYEIKSKMSQKCIANIRRGMMLADTTTIWAYDDWTALIESRQAGFIKMITGTKNIIILSNMYKPRYDGKVTKKISDGIYDAYAETIYSRGFNFSMNVLRKMIVPSRLLLSVTERTADPIEMKTSFIRKNMSNVNDDMTVDVVQRGRAIGQNGYRGNFGGVIQIFKNIARSDVKSSNYGILSGGQATRLSVVSLASGGKGEVRLLDKTFNEITKRQAFILGRQLPNNGNGWTVISSCDNIFLPYGPITVGGKYLGRVKQKIVLFAKKINVRGAHRSDVNYLKDLVTMLVNSRNGELKELYVKNKDIIDGEFDLEMILSRLNMQGGDHIHKGIFYFAVTNEIAKIINDYYSIPSMKNGRPMHEAYALDLETDIIEALTSTKAAWMSRYSLTNIRNGKQITDIYHVDDWEYLWDAANMIKEASNGVAVASLEENSVWADLGTLKEYVRVTLEIVRGRNESVAYKKILGIEEMSTVDHSYVKGVILPYPEETQQGMMNTFYIKNSVFQKGGKVGRNCVIVDSVFEEFTDIPENTIIIGSHIYKAVSDVSKGDRQDKLIYLYQGNPNEVLELKGGLAQATIHTNDGNQYNGRMPIRIDADAQRIYEDEFQLDPVCNHYVLDGNVPGQNILGTTGSYQQLKNVVSVKNSDTAYENLLKYIKICFRGHNAFYRALEKFGLKFE